MNILITGAGGKTGQAIITALHQRGANVRAWVYHPNQMDIVKALGATEVIVGDMRHATTAKQAMLHIDAVYHLCPNMSPHEVEIGRVMISAAQWARVKRFVYHSVLHPQIEAMPHHWLKLRVEEQLFNSGLPVTILQPCAYMQNLLPYWQQALETGRYRVPYPLETRLSLVDLVDVAAVAARVLTESGHEGATYELVGSSAPSQTEIADIFSEIAGRTIQAEAIPLETWETTAMNLPDYTRHTLRAMFDYYAKNNFIGNPNVLVWLLNYHPTSLREFLTR